MNRTTSGRTVTCGQHPHTCTIEDRFGQAHPMTCPYFVTCECGKELGWYLTEQNAWKAAMMHGHGYEVEQDADGGAY